jgi:hypothetical protein
MSNLSKVKELHMLAGDRGGQGGSDSTEQIQPDIDVQPDAWSDAILRHPEEVVSNLSRLIEWIFGPVIRLVAEKMKEGGQ